LICNIWIQGENASVVEVTIDYCGTYLINYNYLNGALLYDSRDKVIYNT
jgi:hypothetical protein